MVVHIMNTPEIANTAEALIQTIQVGKVNYIISQLRLCRKCHDPINVTAGNHQFYFDLVNRIALHEHIKCPDSDFYGHTRTEYSAEEKQKFLYPNH